MRKSVFRKTSTDRLSSPEQMEDYLRVSNPGIWLTLAAVGLLLISFLIWGIFGEIPTTITAKGVVTGGKAVCYISPDEVKGLEAGDTATINQTAYIVSSVGSEPLSKEEAEAALENDYARSQLSLADWNIEVKLEPAEIAAPDGISDISIISEKTNPISFLTN
jgi:hypothetical protein